MDMPPPDDIARYLGNLQHEIDAGMIYRTLAETEKQPQLAELYRRLAETEAQHAGFWEEKMRAAGQTPPPRRPSWRTRVLVWLAKRLGPQFVLPTMIAQERADRSNYDVQADAREAAFPAIERSSRPAAGDHQRHVGGRDGRRTAGPARGTPSGGRRQRLAGGSAGGQRRTLLQSQPGDGSGRRRGRRQARAPRHPGHRSSRAVGRGQLDGPGRVALDAKLARASSSGRSPSRRPRSPRRRRKKRRSWPSSTRPRDSPRRTRGSWPGG